MHQIRAVSLYSYLDVAAFVGIDGYRLLAEAGISPHSLDDPEHRLPAVAAIELLERSAELSRCDDFGIRMAQCRSFASLGAISLLLERLATVREAIGAMRTMRRNLSDVLFVSLEERGTAALVTFGVVPPLSRPQAADLTVGLGYLALVCASHGRWRPEVVHFTRTPPTDMTTFKRFFEAPLSFNSDFDGFSFAAADLETSFPLTDKAMAQQAIRLIGSHHLPALLAPVSDHTRHTISLLLPEGAATIGNVARNLNKTDRVLQRQLSAEGHTFAELLNEVRCDLAQRYLRHRNQTISEIAACLGYATIGSFTRWFTREFGVPPSRWIATHRVTP